MKDTDRKKLDLKRVEIFSPFSHVNGWFTRKNSRLAGKNNRIEGLDCGFNTASSDAEVAENRSLVFETLNLKPENVAFAKQVHGDHIEVVSTGGDYPDADALITERHGLTLAIQVADCAAVLLADPDSLIVAAVHAGWKGAVAGIIPKTVEKMGRLATARPDRMLAYISPCISQQYFEVGGEVSALFPDWFVDSESFAKDHVDLKGYVIQQLLDTGIPGRQIHADPACTYRETHVYYSYRREKEKAGRMLALIQLT
jgi:YfiH family protein